MAGVDRVTVNLPNDLAREIERREKDRSRRRDELCRSLENPHPGSAEFAGHGLEEWTRGLLEEDLEALVDSNSGTPIRWVSGEGGVEWRE